MEPQVVLGLIAGCAALAGVLAFLSLHILRREPQYLRERSKRGEILLLTFDQVMALYNAAPEKWDMQVDGPVYYPQGKGKRRTFGLPAAQGAETLPPVVRLAALPLGRDAGQFQMTAKALLSMQEDLAGHLQRLQDGNRKALQESMEATQRILDRQQEEAERKSQ